MEKRKAHYSLERIKLLIEEGRYFVTRSAQSTAAADFALDTNEKIAEQVMRIKHGDLYKSMTSYNDHSIWHDVYEPVILGKDAYIKLQIVDENSVLISFKEA